MNEVVFATKNNGKLKEIIEILAPLTVYSMSDLNINTDVLEDGATFSENAIKKAVEICKICGKITLADDSGLEIDFLNKAPGIYSARYLGENTPYIEKNMKILEMLKNIPLEKRTARFVCVIAAAFPNGKIITAEGAIEGVVSEHIRGDGGFGYDPIFYVPQYKLTTAEMTAEQKNSISHRGIALRKIKEALCREASYN